MNNAYSIVDQFEKRVAEFAGSRYAVAVDSGTSAIKLSLVMVNAKSVTCRMPCKTYVSVPMAAIQIGGDVQFVHFEWQGVYPIQVYNTTVIDGAKRFKRAMYQHPYLHCLSFHVKKHINIGRGGMILTDDVWQYKELKLLRYDGRFETSYGSTPIYHIGYNAYMTPEQAARGMMLMDVMPKDGFEDQVEDYPDLTDEKLFPVFKDHPQVVR